MLATSYRPQTPHQHYPHHQSEFLPKIPSPLSPRSANIYGRQQQPLFMSGDLAKAQTQNSTPVPYSKRAIKRAPAVSQDALKERRRGMFLKKVREGRDDKRFQSHGEDIMRLDFVQRQKQWEAEQARSAPLMLSDAPEEEEEEFTLPMSSNHSTMQFSAPSTQWQATQEEADAAAQRENEELEALLSFLPGEDVSQPQAQYQDVNYSQLSQAQQADEQMSEHFGSDDDDYDALFSDFINAEAHEAAAAEHVQQEQAQVPVSSGDAMDMS
ncbi:hypothetical protein Q7P37_008965 [Cladosporium fusiforme]